MGLFDESLFSRCNANGKLIVSMCSRRHFVSAELVWVCMDSDTVCTLDCVDDLPGIVWNRESHPFLDGFVGFYFPRQ